MSWKSREVVIDVTQRNKLKKIAGSNDRPEKERCRALVILLLAEGLRNKEIAERLQIHENTVVKWRGRWHGDNKDAKVSDYGESQGRPRSILVPETMNRIADVVASKPPRGKSRWTVRSLAKRLNIPVATCQRALVELEISLEAFIRGE